MITIQHIIERIDWWHGDQTKEDKRRYLIRTLWFIAQAICERLDKIIEQLEELHEDNLPSGKDERWKV